VDVLPNTVIGAALLWHSTMMRRAEYDNLDRLAPRAPESVIP